jgi:hypothetical protein
LGATAPAKVGLGTASNHTPHCERLPHLVQQGDTTKMKWELQNVLAKAKTEPKNTKIQIRSRLVSSKRLEEIKERYPKTTQISNLMYLVKVEPAIGKRYLNVKAIRVYLGELRKNVNSTIERGETPYLLVKKIFSEKRGVYEYELVFMGTRHIEDLSYAVSDPSTWNSWGEIVLSPEEIEDLIKMFQDLQKLVRGTLENF